jgi:hypothetical protein
MSKVHAVLLVPEPGDPHGLLREGPCGARPPVAVKVDDVWVDPWKEPTDVRTRHALAHFFERSIALPTALVLAWGGEPTPPKDEDRKPISFEGRTA